MSSYHTSVMLQESISALVKNPQGTYADVTFGGGGHTAEILSRLQDGGKVIAFDRDGDAIANASQGTQMQEGNGIWLENGRLLLVRSDFRFIENWCRKYGMMGLDGVLADLGVSSHQFDTAERGFSFRYDAALDMRMNTQGGQTAAEFVNEASAETLARVLRLYGELDGAGRLASMIVQAREKAPITTTGDLCAAIEKATPGFAAHKFLAKVFQALRIEVNKEMLSLEKFLTGATAALKPGGALVVITYHSLEDRMVKNFIRFGNIDGKEEKDMYGKSLSPLSAVNRKPILPSEEEISSNTRARSAKLRIAVKNGGSENVD